jgi:hypothetical protein
VINHSTGCNGFPWAEFCYNSSFQESLGRRRSGFPWAEFQGDPPPVRSYQPDDARLPAVDEQLRDRNEFLMEIRERLEQAHQHYKLFYNRHHRELEFAPGQWA